MKNITKEISIKLRERATLILQQSLPEPLVKKMNTEIENLNSLGLQNSKNYADNFEFLRKHELAKKAAYYSSSGVLCDFIDGDSIRDIIENYDKTYDGLIFTTIDKYEGNLNSYSLLNLDKYKLIPEDYKRKVAYKDKYSNSPIKIKSNSDYLENYKDNGYKVEFTPITGIFMKSECKDNYWGLYNKINKYELTPIFFQPVHDGFLLLQ